eukprot:8617173-Pyramimonas_sp.AAC.1
MDPTARPRDPRSAHRKEAAPYQELVLRGQLRILMKSDTRKETILIIEHTSERLQVDSTYGRSTRKNR